MSREISTSLDKAKDQLSEFQSAYDNLKGGRFYWDRGFGDFMSGIAEFLTNHVDDVFSAMDEAVNEIQRLDDENEELREEIVRLEKLCDELEERQ